MSSAGVLRNDGIVIELQCAVKHVSSGSKHKLTLTERGIRSVRSPVGYAFMLGPQKRSRVGVIMVVNVSCRRKKGMESEVVCLE